MSTPKAQYVVYTDCGNYPYALYATERGVFDTLVAATALAKEIMQQEQRDIQIVKRSYVVNERNVIWYNHQHYQK